MLFRVGFVDEKDVDIKVLKPRTLSLLNDCGAIYSRINVGHSYQIEEPSVDYFRVLDLMNHFDSGVGKM